MDFPGSKDFAFSIVDDTDSGTLENIRPIYDLLGELGIFTTKTAWVYPSRDDFTGETLQDPAYLEYMLQLQDQGFEIALHNVGSGDFRREEILEGLEEFEAKIGHRPRLHANHGWNVDCLYWGGEEISLAGGLD